MARKKIRVAINTVIILTCLSEYTSLHAMASPTSYSNDAITITPELLSLLELQAPTPAPIRKNNANKTSTAHAIKNQSNETDHYLISAAQQLLPNTVHQKKKINYVQNHHNSYNKLPSNNTWKNLYSGFRFDNYNHQPRVKKAIRQSARPALLQKLANRSTTFLPTIVAEAKRRGIPTEIAMLPFVESGFIMTAYSHASAAGLWQFIPSTGRIFHLKQGGAYDGRYDALAATHAAFNYLTKLHNEFNDWFLALAAYNCGELRVAREIAYNKRRGRPTDYWHLSLPRETRNYVPKLLAYKELFSHPERFGFSLPYLPNVDNVVELKTKRHIDLRALALRSGLAADTLTKLNRAYKAGITMPRYSQRVIVPRHVAGRIAQAMRSIPESSSRGLYNSKKYARKYQASYKKKSRNKKRRTRSYRVRSGDTLYRIATKHGTSVKKLMKINRLRSTRIKAGIRLRIA